MTATLLLNIDKNRGSSNGKKDEIKNSKEKRKLSSKKRRSREVLMNLLNYTKKSNLQKNAEKNICESIIFEDDVIKFL